MRSLALASILALAPVAALAASLGVPLNQSVLVSLPAPARNVFLGNPTVADVTMSDQRHVVVTGKTGGVTNLIVTDERGRTIFDRQIVVSTAANGDRVSLINGGNVISYACAPSCEQVGDAQAQALGSASPPPAPAAPAPTTTTTSVKLTVPSPGNPGRSISTTIAPGA
jgi:Pilus formation protein N terminal region